MKKIRALVSIIVIIIIAQVTIISVLANHKGYEITVTKAEQYASSVDVAFRIQNNSSSDIQLFNYPSIVVDGKAIQASHFDNTQSNHARAIPPNTHEEFTLRFQADLTNAQQVTLQGDMFSMGRDIDTSFSVAINLSMVLTGDAPSAPQTHDERVADMQAQHDERVADMQAEHDARVAENQAAHDARVAENRAAHEARVAENQASHEERAADMQSQHAERVSEMQAAHNARVSNMRTMVIIVVVIIAAVCIALNIHSQRRKARIVRPHEFSGVPYDEHTQSAANEQNRQNREQGYKDVSRSQNDWDDFNQQ